MFNATFLAIQTNIIEIVFFGGIALIIGFVIHYLWSLRNGNMEMQDIQKKKLEEEAQQWRLKYYDLTEQKQNNTEDLQRQLDRSMNRQIEMQEEMDEVVELNKQLLQSAKEQQAPVTGSFDAAHHEDLQQQLKEAFNRQVEMEEEMQELNELNKHLMQTLHSKPEAPVIAPSGSQAEAELKIVLQKLAQLQQETELLKEQNRQLMQSSATQQAAGSQGSSNDYLQQLKTAQQYLLEHNESIAKLLQQSESLEQVQEKYRQTTLLNETLNHQLLSVQSRLKTKEEELELIQHRTEVTTAMKEQLESAYMEFQEMKEKMERVEMQLAQPAGQFLKYEELEETNRILNGEVAHARSKHKELAEENSKLQQDVTEMEAKMREMDFENQKIAKRNEFLEQLNQDLQQMNDQNKRMETQMRRLTEIESMLTKISGSSH
jgi:hypothetical protein